MRPKTRGHEPACRAVAGHRPGRRRPLASAVEVDPVLRCLPVLLSLLLLGGCAVSGTPPVVDLYGQSSHGDKVTDGSHRVRQGETLYSIAWRYGWDYRDLARINHIAPPYTIYPGELIAFGPNGAAHSADAGSPVPVSSPSPNGGGGGGGAVSTPVAPPAHPKPVSSRTASAAPSKPAPARKAPSSSAGGSGSPQWQWPADGKLLAQFGGTGAEGRGIAIGGRQGSPVVAAAAGQVVYRGSGLTGYGKLIIIKHNDQWLSAYAHNDTMLVKEGQTVKAGEKIATMGASGTYRTELHFEIRKDGKPVNPLSVLPRR